MKSYIEMGLPVVMTRISEIVPYVERYKAGEVIDSVSDLSNAVARIAANPSVYTQGVLQFSDYFEFNSYYGVRLCALAQ